MNKQFASEFLGTLLLLATVVGSGIMGESLAGGNVAIALLANAMATGAMLFVLITIFGPISGAQFNPVVTLAMLITRRIVPSEAIRYIIAQMLGAVIGVWLAHAMFAEPILQLSEKSRWGMGQWVAEAAATFGLILTIFGCIRFNQNALAQSVALYITAAYWFTASTSFANPAVTLARTLTNTFAGIKASDSACFIAAQLAGAILSVAVAKYLFAESRT